MPLPLPNLDDRRFEDLVAEARARLSAYTPELVVQPGDPAEAIIDLFAWLTETILYRANLIPERQRRAFLNLLGMPLRPAAPARGLVCLDPQAPARAPMPAIARHQAVLRAGPVAVTNTTELQPLPLELLAMLKRPWREPDRAKRDAMLAELARLYGRSDLTPFVPEPAFADGAPVALAETLDRALHLAFLLPKRVNQPLPELREALAGAVLSLGVAPPREVPGEVAAALPDRTPRIEIAVQDAGGPLRFLPLALLADSSQGLRRAGVLQLQLPRAARLFAPPPQDDPRDAGRGSAPPELPATADPARLVFWLRLTCPEHPDLALAWLGVNAVGVEARQVARDRVLGLGTGQPDQVLSLGETSVDPDSLVVEVWEGGVPAAWRRLPHLAGAGPEEPAFVLDAEAGTIGFGDGLRGMRLPAGARVVAAFMAFGGGAAGNLPPGALKSVALDGMALDLTPRQELPLAGGAEAESVAAAERRLPAALAHRERAVTVEDFAALAREVPGASIARTEVVAGLVPGASLAAVREDVPGAVAVFVLPPAERALGNTPRPSLGLLRDTYAALRPRTLIGTELTVLSPEFVPIGVSVQVSVVDATARTATLRAVERAVLDYLWALPPGGPRGEGWPLGYGVDPDEIRTRAGAAPGVLAIEAVALYLPSPDGGWRAAPAGGLGLRRYQLPDLVGLSVGTAPPTPPAGAPEPRDGGGVAVPFIPERC
ncbi:putative baseplate assembly protein [Paracraurococcus ruber]|uniref:Baseplate assembly protein n=1 Tax=Paracraurococcus ruber TaxID=77675 RepID=A0ABS1CS51_9PROT|nr:putative baseplate assembly protein [Paracraurococcus ruber]MBK1657112.1 putative baseplate assembly protein [Paracraurococcus ruber]TDG33410.1 putative baseplate assembly protein [Paracraurococcus ruber]